MAAYQTSMTRYYNKKVKEKKFKVGDLVLREIIPATKDSTNGKLAPNWEGPYRVTKFNSLGAYYLEDLEGK